MSSPLPNQSQKKLRVAQINAENLFLFFDEELPAQWRTMTEKEWQSLSRASVANKPLKKALWLADSLQKINADVIMFNEVGGLESLSNFSRYFLSDNYIPHILEGNSDRGIDVGYLIKKSFSGRLELHTHKNRPLHFLYPHEVHNNKYFEKSAPEKVIKTHYFSRDCAELRWFDGDEAAPKVIFLLVHLKSKLDPDGIDPEGKERRAAELRTLVEIYLEVKNEFPNTGVIVGGDFNGVVDETIGETEFKPLFERTDLENVFKAAGLPSVERATQVQFTRNGQSLYLQIDYLFVNPLMKGRLIPNETFVYRYQSDGVKLPIPTNLDQRMTLPSDHYPVVASFNLD